MRPAVLVVDSHPQRLARWQAAVREAGCAPLPAPSVGRARALLHHVRPNLVLSAAQLDDGHSADLLRELRAMALIEDVPLAVLGTLTPQAERELVGTPHVYVRKRDDDDTVITLLDGLLATVRSRNPHRGLLDSG